MPIVQDIKDVRRSGTPLAAITTTDPQATMKRITSEIKDWNFLSYDIIRGLRYLNEGGQKAMAKVNPEDDIEFTKDSPSGGVEMFERKVEPETMCFFQSANRYCDQFPFVQSLKNVRDILKGTRRTVVLLGPHMPLPSEIEGDIVILDDPLPGEKEIGDVIETLTENYNSGVSRKNEEDGGVRPMTTLDEELKLSCIDALIGLPLFTAEQVFSMCLRNGDIDLYSMWLRKKAQVEITPGLSIHRGTGSLDDVGGCKSVVDHMILCMTSNKHFSAIGFIDEIGTTGLASRMDSSGVNQDLEGHLLKYLQDFQIYAVLLTGIPGSGKSHLCKVIGDHFAKPTISMDLGEMKGHFVGDSERMVRGAFDVLTAASHGRPLIIATCNGAEGLSSALLSRFSKIFYFDLPTREEKDQIWKIKMAQYGITDQDIPDDEDWVGRNCDKCCEESWMLDLSLVECAKSIIPVGRSSSSDLDALRAQANGKYLSASSPGIYRSSTATSHREMIV